MALRPTSFSTLSKKKLVLVSGKGGVGKTTISAALALKLSQEGQRVLIAEIDAQKQLATIFHRRQIGYQPTRLHPNLYAINVTPKEAFEEYVVMQLRFRSVYKAVFDNKYVGSFIEGTPGLAELMCIGKIYALVEDYDTIIVDAPATGHGKSLLQVPTIVANAVRVGPLKSNAEKIERLLKDPERTCLAAVSLPEEMPVAETLELQEWTRENLGQNLGVTFLNGIYPPLFQSESDHDRCKSFFAEHIGDPSLNGLAKSYRMRSVRSEMHTRYSEQLKAQLMNTTVVDIPFLFTESIGFDELSVIGEYIAAS